MAANISPFNGGISNQPQTRILPMNLQNIKVEHTDSSLTDLTVTIPTDSPEAANLSLAANILRTSSIPVAFPTETVYGLGADATRSSAVKGIFAAKNRPADNPLIVHICSLSQLRSLLQPSRDSTSPDPIPDIYHSLIRRFWPGPLTILLPTSAQLAPEVSASLPTFGARMPSSPLALALIHESGLPLAAPSANASTRPSPTRAEHVLHDLNGRIEYILDGGSCDVGVESTVVDGLSSPPAVLRPGGVSLAQIRSVPGWEGTVVAYKDADESLGSSGGSSDAVEEKPRAPGMKYKHYAPTAKVVLVKSGLVDWTGMQELMQKATQKGYSRIGILRGPKWVPFGSAEKALNIPIEADGADLQLRKVQAYCSDIEGRDLDYVDASLGRTAETMARNLFRGLRLMDAHNVELIFVEGLDEGDGEEVAAVMNRLKKAAEVKANSLDELVF